LAAAARRDEGGVGSILGSTPLIGTASSATAPPHPVTPADVAHRKDEPAY
jgi:hypothetical protein